MKASYATIGAVALMMGGIVAAGCGDSESATGAGGSGGNNTGGMTVGPGPGPGPAGPGVGGSGGMGDGNDSFDDAVDLPFDTNVSDTLIPAGTDADYFKLTLQEGDLLAIVTDAKPDNDPFNAAFPDLVVGVYDSNETLVAENDDPFLVRNTNDSSVRYRAPADGEYFIRVTDCINWESGGEANCAPAAGITTNDYTVRAIVFDPADLGVLQDSEGGSDIGTANDFTPKYQEDGAGSGDYFATVTYGLFANENDVDVFKINLPANSAFDNALFGSIGIQGPEGPTGIGSTTTIGDAWITEADGTTVISRIDASLGAVDGPRDIRAPMLPATDYYLFIQHPGGAVGTNDFYLFNHFPGDTNPLEVDGASENDVTPEVRVAEANGELFSAFIGGNLDTGDTDRFEIAVPIGFTGTVSAVCGALRSGSGVTPLMAITDQADVDLTTATAETAADDLVISDIMPGAATAVRMVLTPSATNASSSRFYQCAIHFVPPQMMP